MSSSENVTPVNDAEFDSEILKSSQLTLVDFWAEWCGPCKMLSPTIDALAKEMTGKVRCFKMNVDENSTPEKFSIRGIPTVILFKNGKPVEQLVGNRPKDDFVRAIEKHL